jgi:ribosomal protein S18 acetylase RimI-like enzyme
MVYIATYETRHFTGVEALWNAVFPADPPWNKAAVAIPEKLKVQPELFLVAEEAGEVIGTAMAGYDGHRGWLYTIAVKPERQRGGIGSKLLLEAEARLMRLGCGKANLQIRAGNEAVAAFYRRHGYEVEERTSMGKRLGR